MGENQMPKSIGLLVPVALLAACGSQTTTNTTTTNTTTVTDNVTVADNAMIANDSEAATNAAAPANAVAPAATASLAAYEGKQPFDKVNGKVFTESAAVKAAIAGSGADAKVRGWLANLDGPAGPIVLREGKLFMGECQVHNCGDHNWTIAIAPDGTRPEICYYDASAGKVPAWYVDGKRVERPAPGDNGCFPPGL
jgi:hypothetical protein